MKILVMRVKLRAEWVHSLKEKRMIVLSVTKRLKNNFNISVSEVGDQDLHQSIIIGVVAVGTSTDILHTTKENILDFIEENTDAEIINIEEELQQF